MGFDADGRAEHIWDIYDTPKANQQADQQNALIVQQVQNEQMAALKIGGAAVLTVATLPTGGEGGIAVITWGSTARSALITAGASSTVAAMNGQPVAPAFVGGLVTGGIVGPVSEFASTLKPVGGWALSASAGFVGNYAGNSVEQVADAGFSNFNPNESLWAGVFGTVMNPAENNVQAGVEVFFLKRQPKPCHTNSHRNLRPI